MWAGDAPYACFSRPQQVKIEAVPQTHYEFTFLHHININLLSAEYI